MKKEIKKLFAWIIVIALLVMDMNFFDISVKAAEKEGTSIITEKGMNKKSVVIKEDNGTNSFGQMLSDMMQQETDSKEACYITDLTMSDNNAMVSYMTEYDCNLTVAIYTEDGKEMLTSKTVEILSSENKITISFTEENLPTYYLIKGYLLDKKRNMPLGKAYQNDHYTKNFQDFLKKTTNDFEKERILNFDESEITNFAVFKEETVQVIETENNNIASFVDMEKNIYTIHKPSEEVKTLKEGDLFHYQNDTYELMIKVKKVEKNGDTITIIAENTALDEMFDYIKIESIVGENAIIDVDNSNLKNGISYNGITKEKPNVSMKRTMKKAIKTKSIDTSAKIGIDWYTYQLEKEFEEEMGSGNNGDTSKKVKVGINLGFSMEGKVNVYYSKNENEKELEINVALKPKAVADITCSDAFEYTMELGNFAINPISGVSINFIPSIILKSEDSLNASVDILWKVESNWSTSNGFMNKTEDPIIATELNKSVKTFFGIDLKPVIEILDNKMAKISLDVEGGFEIVPKEQKEESIDLSEQQKEEKHLCDHCITGDIIFKEKISIKAKVDLLSEKVKETKLLIENNKKSTDFYYSFTLQKFGLGKCPNREYLLLIKVFDIENKPLESKEVIITGETLSQPKIVKTNVAGEIMEYLPRGTYTISVKNWNDEDDIIKTADLINGSCEITIQQTEIMPDDMEQDEFDENAHGEIKKSGECGKNVHWKLYEDEMLYIYGEGDMYSYISHLYGYSKNYETVKKAWIEKGVTRIGESAFSGCKNLRSIKISEGVTSIGNLAFYGCENLRNVKFPEEVTSTGFGVFVGCQNLTSFEFPNGITRIEDNIFRGCKNLTNVKIPEGVTSIGKYAFCDCSNLKNLKLPDGLTGIEDHAFINCGLTSLELPEGITKIENYLFFQCFDLTSIKIPDGVTSIGEKTFSDCKKLTSVKLSDRITNIEDNAFEYCDNLTIYAPDGSYAQSYAKEKGIPFIVNNTLKTISSVTKTFDSSLSGKVSKLSNKKTRTSNQKVVTRNNIILGEEYLLLVVKDNNAENLLSTENLLYIEQQTAKNKESITFTYNLKETEVVGAEIILGAAACDMKRLENILNDCEKGVYTQSSVDKTKEDLKYAICFVYGMLVPNSQEEINALTEKLETILEVSVLFKEGDVDNSGKVDVNDALIVLKIAASLITPTEEQRKAADVSGDGKVDSSDALLILKYAAGLITEL